MNTVIQRLVRLEGLRSLSVTLIVKVTNSKVAICNLRKSNPNNYGLNQSIISDVGLTNLLFWKSERLLIMGIWSEYHFGIWDKSYNFGSNRFRKCGKCCSLWTTLPLLAKVVTPWHNGCCHRKFIKVYGISP